MIYLQEIEISTLSLLHNMIIGSIPQEIGSLYMLQVLHLELNDFTGMVLFT